MCTFFILTVLLQGFFFSCSSGPKKDLPKAAVPAQQKDSSFFQRKSAYDGLLKKFKPISFDTLKIEYYYGMKGKKYLGTELSLKEAKSLPIEYIDPYYGKFSGVYACYQFPIDSFRTGLIARIPAEYESTTMGLFILDRKKDELAKKYFVLSLSFGDAGDAATRISWLFKTKKQQFQSFVYDYSSYDHSLEDSLDQTIEEWKSYYLIDCMSPKFDTLSKNEIRLKKQFQNLLRTEE